MNNVSTNSENIVNNVSIFNDSVVMNIIFSEQYQDEQHLLWIVPVVYTSTQISKCQRQSKEYPYLYVRGDHKI